MLADVLVTVGPGRYSVTVTTDAPELEVLVGAKTLVYPRVEQ